MSERERDLYALLGVAPDADAREVARAYRRRLREVHPDTRGGLSRTALTPHTPTCGRCRRRTRCCATRPAERATTRSAGRRRSRADSAGDGHDGADPGPDPQAAAGTGRG